MPGTTMRSGLLAACFAATFGLAACGDDENPGGAAGAAGSAGRAGAAGTSGSAGSDNGGSAGEPVEPQAGAGNVAGEGGVGGSAGSAASDAGSAGDDGQPPAPLLNCTRDTTSGKAIQISSAGHDGLFGAAYAADGSLYATGYVQNGTGATEDRWTVVVKLTPAGTLDTTWAEQGIAKLNVVPVSAPVNGSGEMPRGIVLQNGKIVVAGVVEANPTATDYTIADRNVFVLRLNANGTLDTTFAEQGIRILDLNQGTETKNAMTGASQLTGADTQWGLNLLADNGLLVTGAQRAVGFQADGVTPRTDTDFAVVKLTENGALDNTFATLGKFTLDIAQASVSARTSSVLPNGSLIVTGYSTYGGTQRPVIFKLTAAGVLDPSFGLFGVFAEPVGAAGEAYGAALQQNGKLVTVGYGRATAANTTTDLLSIRLTPNGILDSSYGTNGRTWLDVGGFGDNGHAIVMLGDDRPVLIGVGRVNADEVDGAIAVLKADGALDTSFGEVGCKTYDFGTIGDRFWAGALSPNGNTIAAVGQTGSGTGEAADMDGALVLLAKP